MKRNLNMYRLAMVLVGIGHAVASAQETYLQKPATCEPGFEWVQETIYREMECPVCKVVPNLRKKWVYSSKLDYFCVPALHGACGDCGACAGPYCRQVLLKKQIEYQHGTKCVVEMVKEKVPVVVWKKVLCASPGRVPDAAAAPRLLPDTVAPLSTLRALPDAVVPSSR